MIALDANNNALNTLNLLQLTDFLSINNSSIKNVEATVDNHLNDLSIYTGDDVSTYNNYFNFYSLYSGDQTILVGVNKNILDVRAYIYFTSSIIAIVVIIEELCHCFLGSDNSVSNDVLGLLTYIIENYSNFIIIGPLTIEYTSPYLNIPLNTDYKVITNKKILSLQPEIFSFDTDPGLKVDIGI